MGLKNALVQTGICKPEDLERLRIIIQMNDGLHNTNASSCRYFVSLNERIICSVKRISEKGFYNIEDLIKTQEFFLKFSSCTAPAIFGIYHNKYGSIYIVEEYISPSINLEDAVNCGKLQPESAINLMRQIYKEIFNRSSSKQNVELLTREINEFFIAAELLSIPDDIIQLLKNIVDKNIEQLAVRLFLTTRDLIPRNILVSKDKPIVVDFDLSRHTHFLWIDVLRSKYYSTFSLNLSCFEWLQEGIDPLLLELLFLLSEVYLQRMVLSNVTFFRFAEIVKNDIISLYEKVLGENNYQITSIPTNNLPKVDGIPEQGLSGDMLQVFWAKEEIYCEENSIKIPLLVDDTFHQYEFPLPSDIKGHVRLDPGNHPSFVEIERILLFPFDLYDNINKEPLFQWSPENNFNGLLSGPSVIQFKEKELFKLICVNEDPQIFLSIPSISTKSKLNTLRIIMRIEKRISGRLIVALQNELNNLEQEICSKDEELSIKQKALANKEEQLSNAIIAISEREKELKRIQTILAQREGQLSKIQTILAQREGQLSKIQTILAQREGQLSKIQTILAQREEHLSNILGSFSWKITTPLRWISICIKKQVKKRRL